MGEIGGIYEVGIGTRDSDSMLAYWEQFGYHAIERGSLGAEQAETLYGVRSQLSSIRLHHQDCDHGLIRVMVWDQPLNEGLGLCQMRTLGNRWGAILTEDVLGIANHAELAKAEGQEIYFSGPMWDVIYNTDQKFQPFASQPRGVRELMLIRPQTRQFLFQRYNYQLPDYGQINPSAPLLSSQFTHVGIIIQDDSNQVLNFYDQVLGLLRFNEEEWVSTYEETLSGREIFQIGPGEKYYTANFDDPRSSNQDLQKVRSGRLKVVRYPEVLPVEDLHELSRPGSLGFSLYTYLVRDIDDYYRRVDQSSAQKLTPVMVNEFGERSFSFIAPDRYFWTLVEKPKKNFES
ncbi:MAG: VOC family protein [Symploca sp. SIO2E9]|nr:VOC family protein [Symploca sp. SIO2E9]